MDFLAFSHGQTQSKQWLCETLEPLLPSTPVVAILGSWYNTLGFMMLTRKHNRYQSILGIDIDPDATQIANQVCQGWMLQPDVKLNNVTADANDYNLQGFNVVINCSPEHMTGNDWFNNIDNGTLVCIQTSDVDKNDEVWKITNPTYSLDELKEKYPLSKYIISDTKEIKYDDWGYKRFMVIGIK